MALKILHIVQRPQLRGAEVFAAQLCQHLKKNECDVKMVALFAGDAILPFDGELVVLNLDATNRLWGHHGWRRLATIIGEFKPDLVQANAGDTLKYAAFSKLLYRWPAPLVFRNANKVSDFINSTAKKLFNKALLLQVKHVISVSELCRQDFIRTYNFAESRTSMVPIGIEDNRSIKELADDMTTMFGGRSVILNVASMVQEKNQVALLDLAGRLRETMSDFVLVIVGDGKLRPVVESLIREKGLGDHVMLLGYRRDVHALMRHAQVLVVPSLVEGLPGVILEAFAAGLPVVSYDVGGIREVIIDQQTGWLVEKNDEVGLLQAVKVALDDPDMSKQLATRARALVQEHYRNATIARRFLDVYQRLVTNT